MKSLQILGYYTGSLVDVWLCMVSYHLLSLSEVKRDLLLLVMQLGWSGKEVVSAAWIGDFKWPCSFKKGGNVYLEQKGGQ